MGFQKVFTLHVLLFYISANADPCFSNSIITNQDKRSAGYQLNIASDYALNDAFLTDGWYRITGSVGDMMPTSPPGVLRCGTWYPIWLDDTMPAVSEGVVSKKVCMQSFTYSCSKSWNIEIKNCGGSYFVYNLAQSDYDNSAYCFGTDPVKCPTGESSETGYYPGCDPNYPKTATVNPRVEPDLTPGPERIPGNGHSLETMFRCKFLEPIASGESYVYDVRWYINGQFIVLHKNIKYVDITATDLRETNWVKKYYLPMVVDCSVRMRFSTGSTPSPFFNSTKFTAGIFPEKYLYQVKEGETIQIQLQSTFPKGCQYGHKDEHRKQCTFNLKLTLPKYQKEPSKCQNNIEQDDLKFTNDGKKCFLQVNSLEWNKPLILEVTGYVNGMYDISDRATYIKFSSSNDNPDGYPEPWYGVDIPSITVLVTDREHQLSGRLCQSVNDPHFTTTDGQYFDYHEPGEFIMYRHKTKPYEVHTLYSKCTTTGAYCNCGIAIRSGKSLFALRTCSEVSWYYTNTHLPFIEYKTCDDSNMVIQQYGSGYKVTLPIGTEITFELVYYDYYGWLTGHYISYIHIKPSLLDVGNAEGLCGYVTEGTRNPYDDFRLRSGTQLSYSYENVYLFARSWSANSNEQYFIDTPMFLPEPVVNLQQYCTCHNTSTSLTPGSNKVNLECSLNEPLQSCLTQQARYSAFHTTCSNARRRRSNIQNDDVIDVNKLVISSNLEGPIPPEENITWPEGWTEQLARNTCESNIRESMTNEIINIAHIDLDGPIRNCISDIKMSGSTVFLKDAVKSVMVSATTEISRNGSLFESDENQETGTNKTLAYFLLNSLCPNNCSKHGVCENGYCICEKLYGTEDCSEDLSKPPVNISIPRSGLCNTRERPCLKTNINGMFYANEILCKRRHFQVFNNNTVVYSYARDIVNATFMNSFLISCDLSSGRKKRSLPETIIAEGYEISVSYDGNTFSDGVKIVIYDESCYSCDAVNVTCALLDTCPYLTTSATSTTTTTTTSRTAQTSTALPSATIASTTTQISTTFPSTTTNSTTTQTTTALPSTTTTSTTAQTSTALPSNTTPSKTTHTSTTLPATTIPSTTAQTTTAFPSTTIPSTTAQTSTALPSTTTPSTTTINFTTTQTSKAISSTTTPATTTQTSTTLPATTITSTTIQTRTALLSTTTISTTSTLPSTNNTAASSRTEATSTITTSTTNLTTTSAISTGTIIGVVLGIVFVVALLIGGFIFYKKTTAIKGHKEDNIVRVIEEYNGKSVPPLSTQSHNNSSNKYYREHSSASIRNLSLDIDLDNEDYERPKTPTDLFCTITT